MLQLCVWIQTFVAAFEMEKCFTRPLPNNVVHTSSVIIEAPKNLNAKRKLKLILSSKAPKDINLSYGDLVEVYVKNDKEKRGKWPSLKTFLGYALSTVTFTLPASKDRVMRAAMEYIRHAIHAGSFASMIRQANNPN